MDSLSISKSIIKKKNIVSIALVIILLLAVLNLPYGYYTLLRWVVTAGTIFLIWVAYKLEKRVFVWIMTVIAILFNPIAPIYLAKETWVVIDFIIAITFIVSIFKIKAQNNNL